MKKLIFCFSFVCMGMVTSCVDKNELVDEESKPSWLGESIYSELKNPDPSKGLTGTFNTYLRLVDDLNYADVLNRTGSNTVFPANDEAFAKFFENEVWEGVKKYEDLSDGQKKLLLNSSMLNNALLVGMLANNGSSSGIDYGRALKHSTAVDVIDSVTYYTRAAALNAYGERNPYWTVFNNGVSFVSDATTPMLVHFTREYMLTNGITTDGAGSDFSILTGGSYETGSAYVFENKIIAPDVTCQNGYIHQMDNVIVPPGNMANVIKKEKGLSVFNHMLDRFAVPVYNSSVTLNYKNWYKGLQDAGVNMAGINNPDSIYEVRYLSRISQDNNPFTNDNTTETSGKPLLALDPGWNEFYIKSASTSVDDDKNKLTDIAAMFVPTDEALTEYLVNGDGKTILDTYGSLPNTKENVMRNIEDIPMTILAKFISNMMKTSFAASVPSKFSSIVDDAKDVMGVTLETLDKKEGESGAYNIKIANNGVVYVTNKVFGPKEFVAVSAPALFSTEMNVINWMIQNQSINNNYSLGLDFYAYLLSMASNYALFLPTDKAFDAYYIDPASLGHTGTGKNGPLAYHYYYVPTPKTGMPNIGASRWVYDLNTKTVKDSIDEVDFTNKSEMAIVKAQLSDLLQFGTVALSEKEKLGRNDYYKTKHGGTIKVSGTNNLLNGQVVSGAQINEGVPASKITEVYEQSNGMSYAIDHLIQGPYQSVYKVLSTHEQFSEFFSVCQILSDGDILDWAGFSNEMDATGLYEVDRYKVFYMPGERSVNDATKQARCLDYNVKFFNNYNYTLYAPNNGAMEKAYKEHLPNPADIIADFEKYKDADENNADAAAAKDKVNKAIEALKAFVRYHFQNTSVFVDKVPFEKTQYLTFLVDNNNISQVLSLTGGNGVLNITDASGKVKTIDASKGLMVNEMTRDFEFDGNKRRESTYVTGSSFAVIHELTEPLSYNASGDYGNGVTSSSAKRHGRLRK